ncbi:MAG: peptide ABC transporter substrate-binding protein [Chloroflexota bacterium]
MHTDNRFNVITAIAALMLIMAACVPTTPSPTSAPAQPAAQPTAATAGQPAERAPAVSTGPRRGGTLRIGLSQEPIVLNPIMGSQTVNSIVSTNMLEGLLYVGADGAYHPGIAAEVPSPANGGVSADGLTITWKLKPGVLWSDGKPVTSEDVVFTYRVFTEPQNPIPIRVGYSEIESVTAPDSQTVVVKYKRLYAPFREHLSPVLPAHVLGGNPLIDKLDFNRAPVGTGPFRFVNWASGDSITLERNPHFRDAGKPYLDSVIFKIVPSREAAIQAYKVGEIDILWNLAESNIPEFEAIADSVIQPKPSPRVERLILNASCPSGPQQGDPACPHPVLGDLKVRQAIELAIDKQAIVDKLLFGKTTVATSVIPLGWFAPTLQSVAQNPARAKQLMDDAGWQTGADGVRLKNGVRASLEFGTTTGDRLREQTQQVIQEQLRDIGIAVEIKNSPSAVLLGGWQDSAPRARGNFDMLMWTTNVDGLEPQAHLDSYFRSGQIPTEQARSGRNYHRITNPLIDESLARGGGTLDEAQRRAAYETVAEQVNADKGHIVLFNRLLIDAYKKHVKGWEANVYDNNLAWDSESWWVDR